MSRLALVAAALVLVIAACSPDLPGPSAAPPQPTATPDVTPSPVAPPPASPGASDGPSPSAPPPAPTPGPTASPQAVTPTVEEAILLRGVRDDLVDCRPLRGDLPDETTGAIECLTSDPAVARVGFFLFDGSTAALAAYDARMDAEDVPRDTVACINAEGAGEAAYIPGEDGVGNRHGCFVNAEGYANYRAVSGLLYIGILGRSVDMEALADFAWRGNQDTPGMPTLWTEPAE